MTIAITDVMILPRDVLLTPCAALEPAMRRRLGARRGAFVLARPGTRARPRLLDSRAAGLLRRFRTPIRIVDAVRAHSRAHRADAERVLDASFGMLRDCLNDNLLVPANSPAAGELRASHRRGERVGRFRLLRLVKALDDTETYQARGADGAFAFIKVARPGAGSAATLLAREAAVLRRLAGRSAPVLLAEGTVLGKPWLAQSWCAGTAPEVVARELREAGSASELRELCVAIAAAYAALHAAGVIHGDVNASNVLVDAAHRPTICDFGVARLAEQDANHVPRGVVERCAEPEYARARLAGRPAAPATAASDQYSVAALLYRLLTGRQYLDFAVRRRALLQQIARDEPLSFAQRGAAPWPDMERVLRRALAKQPGDRFASMAAFARALGAARLPRRTARRADAAESRSVRAFATTVVRQLHAGGRPFRRGLPHPPTCSVTFGAAGIAYGLYRLACSRSDPALLSAADAWLTAAERGEGEGAFWFAGAGLDERVVGHVGPYYARTGVHVVRALVSQVQGDGHGARRAVEAFVAASGAPCDKLDLMLGRCGTLMGCALLLDALPATARTSAAALRALGDRTLRRVWRELRRQPRIHRDRDDLGVAHGWAGYLYATMRWCRASGCALPDGTRGRLDELAACAERLDRGIAWRTVGMGAHGIQGRGLAAGWCNGAAGFALLWALAYQVFGDAPLRALALDSAWSAWSLDEPYAHLCCGAPGRAYAALSAYRLSGDAAWLRRARTLGERAVALAVKQRRAGTARHPLSLYRGELGIAVLGDDLAHPWSAAMPFFEDEGWPRP